MRVLGRWRSIEGDRRRIGKSILVYAKTKAERAHWCVERSTRGVQPQRFLLPPRERREPSLWEISKTRGIDLVCRRAGGAQTGRDLSRQERRSSSSSSVSRCTNTCAVSPNKTDSPIMKKGHQVGFTSMLRSFMSSELAQRYMARITLPHDWLRDRKYKF